MHHVKCQAGWITSWNQDCQKKFQQPQVCRWYHSSGRKQEKLKSLLMKENGEKAGLKLNTPKIKIMALGPMTSWQMDGKNGNSDRLYFLGLQNRCDGDCSHDIKRCSLLERKTMTTNIDSVLKSRGMPRRNPCWYGGACRGHGPSDHPRGWRPAAPPRPQFSPPHLPTLLVGPSGLWHRCGVHILLSVKTSL